MLFNSIDFAVFLPIVFILYWLLYRSIKAQNSFLLFASYVFYGWWDYRFLSLIAFSTIVDYFVGRQLGKENSLRKRKFLLWTSIIVNLGFLAFFKYYNFFLDSLKGAFSLFGQEISGDSLNIILPVGISFYTFQTLSYTIDVYRKRLKPTNDFINFAAYVSFFPQLVAGPIERAKKLLPQFSIKRELNPMKARDGMRQMLWGLFKKVVVADNCAKYVNEIFSNYDSLDQGTLILGAILFAFQIYCDFSGYSDIAIGLARLFGFELSKNFSFPYFSRDIAEFWRRWHISLSTWFRDYVYIPLGGSKVSMTKAIRNIFVIFLVSGFWHGANWTFIFWGGLNALYFLPLFIFKLNRKNLNVVDAKKNLPSLLELFQMLATFTLVTIGWIFFRADNVQVALDYIYRIFTQPFVKPAYLNDKSFYIPIAFIFLLLIVEWFQRGKEHGLDFSSYKPIKFVRWFIYFSLCVIIFLFAAKQQDFIYFQF